MAYKAQKVGSDSTNGFDETVAFKILHCTNVDGNNNKYFSIEPQKNPATGEFRIFTQYGRLNGATAFDLRGPDEEEPLRKEFDAIVRKKTKGKKVKQDDGTIREERYVEIDTQAPAVGSPNIRKTRTTGPRRNFHDVFADDDRLEAEVRTLLTQLLEENIHQITGLADIKVSDTGLETPLGPVTAEHLAKAKALLDELRQIATLAVTDAEVRRLNTAYYSLIPHSFGSRITDRDMIADAAKLLAEYDLLEQMETAVRMAETSNRTTTTVRPDLPFRIELLRDPEVHAEIVRRVETSRRHCQLDTWKVKRIFTVENFHDRTRYTPLPGPEYDLFHGSKNANILSILNNGFMIPPVSAPHVTGRMFGNGVYGASAVTKSLNYSTGYWDGRANRYDNTFVFVTRFSMGRVFETDTAQRGGLPRAGGYQSIHAKAGPSLANDEYIVYDPAQTTLTHLIEFTRS